MANIWFTSDFHFCHDKSFIYESRGFLSVEEMNEAIVENYNSLVKEEDKVYILGDLALGNIDKAMKYLKALKGHKYIVLGNHDTPQRRKNYLDIAHWIRYAEVLKYSKRLSFYLSHYPTLTGNFEERNTPWNLCGHTHQPIRFFAGMNNKLYNVGIDAHNCYPIAIEEIVKDMREHDKEVKRI